MVSFCKCFMPYPIELAKNDINKLIHSCKTSLHLFSLSLSLCFSHLTQHQNVEMIGFSLSQRNKSLLITMSSYHLGNANNLRCHPMLIRFH